MEIGSWIWTNQFIEESLLSVLCVARILMSKLGVEFWYWSLNLYFKFQKISFKVTLDTAWCCQGKKWFQNIEVGGGGLLPFDPPPSPKNRPWYWVLGLLWAVIKVIDFEISNLLYLVVKILVLFYYLEIVLILSEWTAKNCQSMMSFIMKVILFFIKK